jgi:hypothetical protein
LNGVLPPELIQIIRTEQAGNNLLVTVQVWKISKTENDQWIVSFDEDKDLVPAEEKRIEQIRDKSPRQEIHRWINTGGTWMISEARIVLTQ